MCLAQGPQRSDASEAPASNKLVIAHLFIKQFRLQQYNKTMATLKKTKIGFQSQLSLNAGQKYCRMLQGEHSAILFTFMKLPIVIKIFVLSIFEWLFYTGFTVALSGNVIQLLTYV